MPFRPLDVSNFGSCKNLTPTVDRLRRSCRGLLHPAYLAYLSSFISEPPKTRTWNLEIKSLCRRSSSGCWKLHNPLRLAEITASSLPNVSRCCSGLVLKLVSVTVSLTTARVREGLQNTLRYLCHRRVACFSSRTDSSEKGYSPLISFRHTQFSEARAAPVL